MICRGLSRLLWTQSNWTAAAQSFVCYHTVNSTVRLLPTNGCQQQKRWASVPMDIRWISWWRFESLRSAVTPYTCQHTSNPDTNQWQGRVYTIRPYPFWNHIRIGGVIYRRVHSSDWTEKLKDWNHMGLVYSHSIRTPVTDLPSSRLTRFKMTRMETKVTPRRLRSIKIGWPNININSAQQ